MRCKRTGGTLTSYLRRTAPAQPDESRLSSGRVVFYSELELTVTQWATTATKGKLKQASMSMGLPGKPIPFHISLPLSHKKACHLVTVLATRRALAVKKPLQSLYPYAAVQQPSKKPPPRAQRTPGESALSQHGKLGADTVVFTRPVTREVNFTG